MSAGTETQVPTPVPGRMSRLGVSTVARLELRQRVRATRWKVVLGVWVVVLALLTTLIRLASGAADDYLYYSPEEIVARQDSVGVLMFAVVAAMVLGLGALIAPAISATSVNGDRANGVLATLQTTLLTPGEIALGKLLASWATALALLVTSLPFVLWAYFTGGTSFGRLLVVIAVLTLTLLVVCAVGLAWSAVTSRTTSSAVLTYLTVMFLIVGFPLLFGLATPLVTTDETQSVVVDHGQPDAQGNYTSDCREEEQVVSQTHTERVWWLLAPSPFVVLADASPAPDPDDVGVVSLDPLTEIRQGVRAARLGPDEESYDWCSGTDQQWEERERRDLERQNALSPIWPFGLAFNLLVAGGAFAVTVRRLRTPTRTLPRGTRVA